MFGMRHQKERMEKDWSKFMLKTIKMYLKSSAASSAFGFVADATRFTPFCVVLGTAEDGGLLPSISLLTRSWIPTS